MLTTIAIGGFAGFLLGLRFKAFVLLPSIALALVAVGALGGGHGAGRLALAMVAAALSIQFGYLAGAIVNRLIATAHDRAAQPSTHAVERIQSAIRREHVRRGLRLHG